MSKETKKTSSKSSSKKTTTKSKVKNNDIVEIDIDKKDLEVDVAIDDSARQSSKEEETLNASVEEKASKVFWKMAAYSWWKKLSWINVAWTFGVVLLILAFAWKSDLVWKYHANIIFASLVSGLSLIAIVTLEILYFCKKIKSFDQTWNLVTMICFIIPLVGFILGFISSSFEEKRFYNNQKVKDLGYKKPKFVMPHVYIILMIIIFVIIVVSWLVTWTKGPGSETVPSHQAPAGFLYLLIAPIQGFVDAADLIIFLLIMGGFLAIVTESGALEAGLGRMVKKLQGKEIVLVPILFILFSIGGATYGMAEETIPFYLLLIPVFLAAGFDTYTAFLVILLGAGLGTAASILNPFVVNTSVSAVNGAGEWTGSALSPSIGIAWRSAIYVVLVIVGLAYVTWYAWRVKKHPEKSAVYDLKKEHEKHFSFNLNSLPEFTIKRKIILAIFALTFVSMIISVITWPDVAKTDAFQNAADWVNKYFPYIGGWNKDGSGLIGAWGTWYLVEMSFLFFLSSIIIGGLSWKGSIHFINKFMAGAADFIGVAIVIAISRGISITVGATGLDKIIIDGLSGMIKDINNVYGVVIIFFIIFFALSFLIPSTSGFAGAVFPIIGPAIGGFGMPVALGGLTISGSIASFSLASGIVNISMPSGGIFMSALSVSKIPLGKFYKSSWWFILGLLALSIVLLLVGQAINRGVTSNNPIF